MEKCPSCGAPLKEIKDSGSQGYQYCRACERWISPAERRPK